MKNDKISKKFVIIMSSAIGVLVVPSFEGNAIA